MIDTQNPAFINTELESLLREKGITELVVCGVLIHHSVDATVRATSDVNGCHKTAISRTLNATYLGFSS